MNLAFVLVLLFALLPWPLVRWACLTLALFLLVSAAWSALLKRFLVVSTDFPRDRAFSGQKIDVRYRLENRGVLPSGVLFVTDSAGNLETYGVLRHFLALSPRERAAFAHELRGRERGRVALGPFTVAGGDPAGWFPFRRVQKDERSLVVYPRLVAVDKPDDAGFPPGPRQDDRFWAEDTSRFRSYREFRDGDDLSRLVASASSRWQAPVVRTFDRTRAFPVLVFVDVRLASYPLKQRWALVDQAVETAATLVWQALRRGETVWLSLVGHRVEGEERWGPGRGDEAAAVFLEALALARSCEGEVLWDEDGWWASLPTPPLRVHRVLPRPERAREPRDSRWRDRWTVVDVHV